MSSTLYFRCCCCISVKDIVQRINRSLDEGSAEETHKLLQKEEGKFPTVLNRSALLYHNGLLEVKQQELQVTVYFLLDHFCFIPRLCILRYLFLRRNERPRLTRLGNFF